MDFILQHNMLSNELLERVRLAVEGLPHTWVGLIPFSREITSNEPLEGIDHIPYGSTSFVEETHRLGWKGLSFDEEQFSYKMAKAHRIDMLNGDYILPAVLAARLLGQFNKTSPIFMRPAHDLKQFSGAVYTVEEAADFLIDAMKCASSGSYHIPMDLDIMISQPQNILAEWRWFIVGSQVIDGSMYRRNGQLHKEHVTVGDLLTDAGVFKDAQKFAEKWLPSPCCVMDTCLLANGATKVVEFNCINGSGFYDHDIKKVMHAWWKYHNP